MTKISLILYQSRIILRKAIANLNNALKLATKRILFFCFRFSHKIWAVVSISTLLPRPHLEQKAFSLYGPRALDSSNNSEFRPDACWQNKIRAKASQRELGQQYNINEELHAARSTGRYGGNNSLYVYFEKSLEHAGVCC
jgi:hypothetical protein